MLANYHTHTTRCHHAKGTDREYVEEAIKAGYQTLGFADHCPWVFPDGYVSNIRMIPSEVDEYFSSLENLRKEYQKDIRILIGFEAEYMPHIIEEQDKFLKDYPLDYMILGQHFVGVECFENYAGNETDSTQILSSYVDLCIEGMKSGRYLYLAHPDLIYFTGDIDIYQKEMRRLCLAMKELDVCLEMNVLGYAMGRNYPNPYFWDVAREVGNKAILGVDAHSPKDLSNKVNIEKAKMLCNGLEIFDNIL